jgi:hypothetical protein
MRRPATYATLLLGLVLAAGGCGSSSRTGTTAGRSTGTTSVNRTTTAAVSLEQAVRKAITEEHALSGEVLWTDRVPANPSAIGGPALAVLRQAVAQRRSAGVRVRVLSEHFRILNVNLDPSYATATATVIEDQRVQPTDLKGRRQGGPSEAHERVRLDLRRVGNGERFIVWKVTLLR